MIVTPRKLSVFPELIRLFGKFQSFPVSFGMVQNSFIFSPATPAKKTRSRYIPGRACILSEKYGFTLVWCREETFPKSGRKPTKKTPQQRGVADSLRFSR